MDDTLLIDIFVGGGGDMDDNQCDNGDADLYYQYEKTELRNESVDIFRPFGEGKF